MWALLPILLVVWGTVGFWLVYAMAVANGSVNITVVFPYISTCGSDPPQSCIFSQVLNMGAFLVVWISYLRFQQVRDWGYPGALNTAGLILGLLCALGASVVANFQQSNQLETHLFGVFLAFVVGVVYFWVQAVLSSRVKSQGVGCWVGPARFCLSAGSTALLVTSILGMDRHWKGWEGAHGWGSWGCGSGVRGKGWGEGGAQGWDSQGCGSGVKGTAQPLPLDSASVCALHGLGLKSEAAICEWTLTLTLFLLFGLFAEDFRHIESCSVRLRSRAPSPALELGAASTQTLAS